MIVPHTMATIVAPHGFHAMHLYHVWSAHGVGVGVGVVEFVDDGGGGDGGGGGVPIVGVGDGVGDGSLRRRCSSCC